MDAESCAGCIHHCRKWFYVGIWKPLCKLLRKSINVRCSQYVEKKHGQ